MSPHVDQRLSADGVSEATGYEAFAGIYDDAYAGFDADIPFWLSVVDGADKVLEAGCGTGRVTAHLVDANCGEVSGIDASPAMIGIARAKVRAEFSLGDIRLLPFPNRTFDVVLATRGVYSHLVDVEDQLAAMFEFLRVVRPGGRVVVDVPRHPLGDLYSTESTPWHETRTITSEGRKIAVTLRTHLDTVGNFYNSWQRFTDPSRPAEAVEVTLRTKICTPDELVLAFRIVGLTCAGMFGDYDQSPLGPLSPRIIIVGTRPA